MHKTSRGTLVALGAGASALLIGCASVAPTAPLAWRVEPLLKIGSGGDAAGGRAFHALGQAYQGEGRWQEAAEAYSKAAFADPDNAEALHALGIAQAVLFRYDGAIAAFSRAVDLAPERAQYLNNLGYALLLNGDFARAAPYLRAALAREPDHVQARVNLIRAEQALEPTTPTPTATPAVPAETAQAETLATEAPLPDVVTGAPEATPETGPMGLAATATSGATERGTTLRLSGFRVEISNGNGVRGAASRLREWLRERGLDGARISNLKPYASPATVVQYQPGFRPQALEIARRMPDGVGIAPAEGDALRSDVRVVIGHDVKSASPCRGAWPCAPMTPTAQAQSETSPTAFARR